MEFEWDSAKAKANKAKHGIDFADAIHVFRDEYRLEKVDARFNPERFRALGLVDGVLLIVAFEERKDEKGKDKIRIISARPAEKKEKDAYRKRTSRF